MKSHNHIEGSGRRCENRKRTVMVLLIMILCLSETGVRTFYASQEAPQAAVPDTSQGVPPETTGNTTGTTITEYGNLGELLKQGNLSLKESIEDCESNTSAYQKIWDTFKWEQDNMEDKTGEVSDEDSQTAGTYSSNAITLKSSVSRIYSQPDTITSEKSTYSLGRSADTFTMAAQTLMNSYSQMIQNMEYQEKQAGSLQAAFRAMVRKQATGIATQAQLKEAKKSLDTAGNSLESPGLQTGELHRRPFIMLGVEDSGQVVIGAISEPDMVAIEAVDYESDKNRVIGNDKNVQNTRHTPASSTTEINIGFRLADEAEGTKEATFLISYQNLRAGKAAYEAVLIAFQSVRLTYEGLQRKQQVELLTSMEYLEGQAAYLGKKAVKETASMNLTTTYGPCCWDVKGIGQAWYVWPESGQ